jgi:hypothetical protein
MQFRRMALAFASTAMSPILFRLTAGVWPNRRQNRKFKAALCDNSVQLPAIPRAMMAEPAGRKQIAHMISFYLIAEGVLPRTAEGGISPLSGNPLSFWQGSAISFLHFERTGGTSLAAALTDKFHPLQIAGATGPDGGPVAPSADHKLVWGHFDLAALRRLGPDNRIITILRDPTARILSLYYFWRSIHPSKHDEVSDSRVMLAQELDLLSFLRNTHQPLRDSIDNVYVRRLAGVYAGAGADDPLVQRPETVVSQAMEALERIGFIGISEHMPETFRGIETLLGVPLGRPQRLNDTAANPTNQPTLFLPVEREKITPEIQAELAHLTRLDYIIYESCRAKLMSNPT